MEECYLKKLKIGNVELNNNVLLAPMAGITDRPFRIICEEYGPGLVCTEMISSKGLYYDDKKTSKRRAPKVTISTAAFIPKPFTPFQWEAQDNIEKLKEKQQLLKESNRCRKVKCNYHDAYTSFIEAVFARGDRKLSKVLLKACDKGLKFDGWREYFDFDKWLEVFKECEIEPEFYACRKRSFHEVLPWDHLDYGISKEFLINECKKAYAENTSENCKQKCLNCGASCFEGGICYEKRKA